MHLNNIERFCMEGLAASASFWWAFQMVPRSVQGLWMSTIQNKMSRVWMRLIHYGEGTK